MRGPGILMRRRGGSPGQALVEFVVVFPCLMLLALTLIQAALLYEARHLVQYAAFAAARAAVVGGDAGEAAVLVCLPIAGRGRATPAAGPENEKTTARVTRLPHEVEVEVEHHLELIVPLAGRLMASFTTESRRLSARYQAPHFALRAVTRLADATPI